MNQLIWLEKLFFKILNAISSEPLTILPVIVFILVLGIVFIVREKEAHKEHKDASIMFMGWALIIALVFLIMRGCIQDEYSYNKSVHSPVLKDNNQQ